MLSANSSLSKKFPFFFLFMAALAALLVSLWGYTRACMADGMGPRELAEVLVIRNIQTGQLQSVEHFPDNIYLYGVLKPAILSLVPFGPHTVILNRAISVFFLLAACGVMWGSIRHLLRISNKKLHSLIILFILTVYFSTCRIDLDKPDALGFLLSNLILYLALKNYRINFILYPVLLVFCYMTKQYYLHAFLYVLSGYLILHARKKYLAHIAFVCLASAIGLFLLFTLPQTRFAFMHHLNVSACADIKYMIFGWFAYSRRIFPVLILIFPAVSALISGIRDKKDKRNTWRHMLHRLKQNRILSFLCINLILHSLIMFRMAQHTGAPNFFYFSHIFAPILFLCITYAAASYTIRPFHIITASIFLLFFTLKKPITFSLPEKISTPEYTALVKEFSQSGNKVRGCAATSWIEYRCNRQPDDNGQLCYLSTGFPDFLPTRFPKNGGFWLDAFKRKAVEYQNNLVKKIKNREYDVIYADSHCFVSQDGIMPILEEYYTKEKELYITKNGTPIFRYIPK